MIKGNNSSNNSRKSIATALRCNPTPIPVEFTDHAKSTALRYQKSFSLTGLYVMDYDTVYARACNLVNDHLKSTPSFEPGTFSKYINADTLFYSQTDIQTLTQLYNTSPEEAFPYVICFFSRKLHSFKRCKIAYIKNLEPEEVDEVMMIALYKTLERYNPRHPFSFSYLDLELFAAITQLGGEMHTFGMPRNDYTNYMKFSYFIERYSLTSSNLECFLEEINLTENERSQRKLTFAIDEKDLNYGCRITRRKAWDYYSLYAIEHNGIVSATYYDETSDSFKDRTTPSIESGYANAEMDLFSEQAFTDLKDQRIFYRLMETDGASFTNDELKNDYGYTRYALSKLKEQIKKEFF
ncbi:MAG: hypothetical protein SPG09_03800 [Lachnospiraceae bacterium]|nr:hypothetical protein [bacterium]MDY5516724.1 hypothetical protein [Lachnospiraceae bacterium]